MNHLEILVVSLLVLASVLSAGHALLYRRDPRASLLWVIVTLYFVGVGPLLYWLFGINRIRTHAKRLKRRGEWDSSTSSGREGWRHLLPRKHPLRKGALAALLRLGDQVAERPLMRGNRVDMLRDGDEAYPVMLREIERARECIYLSTYIFATDGVGRWFTEALARAVRRGVRVRVLVDALGEYYSWPRIRRWLRQEGVPFARFLPFSWVPQRLQPNLRNHRKLLLVDGCVGFTGGLNLGDRHLVRAEDSGHSKHRDLHFRVEGPVVSEMQEVFIEDWYFATRESLPWTPYRTPARLPGRAVARGVRDGPNEDFEKILWILLGAVAAAKRRIRILTPYFIPTQALLYALNTAALRGVAVEILLPSHNNLPYVDWASRAFWWELLEKGVRIFVQPPPFHHGKLFLVDEAYAQVGSANWDPRSLRLNFEFNLEVVDADFAQRMNREFERLLVESREVTLAEVRRTRLPTRLRNGFARLFSPYL